MNTTQQGVITLLKTAVTGQAGSLPEDFDLETVYPELKKHNMDALLYEGAVHCGLSRQMPVMQMLFQKYCKHLLASEGQQRQVERVFSAFEENGIDYLPLKGCRMKNLYPKPELRYMGDADILIQMEQYPKIRTVMEALGFAEKSETDHELHWEHRELQVELHKRLIPSYNGDFYDYFGVGWQMASAKEGHYWTMTPENEWIFLFTHFAKHFRDGGIGCRYVADLWIYLRHHPDMDEAYIRGEMEKLQLLEFHENVRRLIAVWFEDSSADEKMEIMTQYIFASGSWGEQESKAVSAAVRDSRKTLQTSEGKLRYILRVLFPDVKTLRDKYTVLKKTPWLLPVVWLIRPFYKVLWELPSLRKHKENLQAINRDNLNERRALLNDLGINYHF